MVHRSLGPCVRSILAFGVVLLVGCPDPPPPAAPPPRPAAPQPADPAVPTPSDPAPPTPLAADPAAPAPPAPPPAPPPPAPPPQQAPPQGPWGEPFALERGTRHRVGSGDRALGLVDVEAAASGAPARARIDVAAGPCFLQALLPEGATLEVGGEALELVSLAPPKTIRLRSRAAGTAQDPLRKDDPPPDATPGPRRYGGLTMHTLSDGARLGVGNVRREGAGPTARTCVTLTLFPAGYEKDPMQGYDLHLDATQGATLEGKVRVIRVTGLELGTDGVAGKAELDLRPPG